MAKPSKASVEELEKLLQFSRAAIDYLVARGGLSESMGEAFPSKEQWSQATQDQPSSAVLAGARQGAHDMVSMLDDFLEQSPDATIEQVDAHLVATGAPGLTQMRSRVWELLANVLRRGSISTDTECRAIIELLSDVGPSGPSEAERKNLNFLLAEFERSTPAS